MSQFSERLSSAIDASGLTKAEIARDMDIHPPALSRWLADTVPSSKHLTRLCRILNVNAQWLLTGAGPMRDGIGEEAEAYGRGAQTGDTYTNDVTVDDLQRGLVSLLETFTRLPSENARLGVLDALQTLLDQMKDAAREGRWK